MRSLSNNLRTVPLSFGVDRENDSSYVGAGTLDTTGFGAVRFLVMVHSSTGAVRFRLKGADQPNGFSSVSSSSGQLGEVVEVDSVDSKLVVLEVVRPRQRYLRLEFRRVAVAQISAIWAELANPSEAPVTPDESVAAQQVLVEPLP